MPAQIRRSLHRLQDSLAIIEKNTLSLQTNAISVTEEIDEIYRRITKAIKDRSDQLKGEIDRYLAVELRNLTTLKENLDLEITNITSNCDIVDKYMNDTVEWDDCELMDTKEIFLKTVEFLRHFEYENNDYSRRVRFIVSIDPNQLVMNLATFGDLNIAPHSTPGGSVSSSHLAPPSALQPGLMRSKSDHRLATQFRQQEERGGYNDEPVLGGRKFGERPQRVAAKESDRYGDRSYGRSGEYDYDNDYENEPTSRAGKSGRFRSRFVRSHQNDDSDSEQQQQQRQQEIDKRKDRVLDSEDVSRGQLSGIIRLSDCSRVVQRLADIGKEKKETKSDAAIAAQAAVQAAIQAQKAAMQRQQQKNQQSAAAADEKRKTAAGGGGAATSTADGESSSEQRPNSERVTALKRGGQGGSEESDSSSNQAATTASPVRTATTAPRAEVSVNEANEEEVGVASDSSSSGSGSGSSESESETESESESEEEEAEEEEAQEQAQVSEEPQAEQEELQQVAVATLAVPDNADDNESSSEYEYIEVTASESEESEERGERETAPVINVVPPEDELADKEPEHNEQIISDSQKEADAAAGEEAATDEKVEKEHEQQKQAEDEDEEEEEYTEEEEEVTDSEETEEE